MDVPLWVAVQYGYIPSRAHKAVDVLPVHDTCIHVRQGVVSMTRREFLGYLTAHVTSPNAHGSASILHPANYRWY